MLTLRSYLAGAWRAGDGPERTAADPVTGEVVARFRTGGHDLGAALTWGRERGGSALRERTFRERGGLVSGLAASLREHREEFRALARSYGATEADARHDVDGGIGTLAYYGRLGASLPDQPFLADGAVEPLSRGGGFAGRHLLTPREGIAVQINAYNFPAWGPLEKLGPALLAGVPTLVKPATRTAALTCRIVERLLESGELPEGALQLLVGPAGDLLDHLEAQDVVLFTGSAETGNRIRSHERVVSRSVRVNIEADSLNAAVLGPDGLPGTAVRRALLGEVRREVTVKAGQKCTAIRRVFVPEAEADSFAEELGAGIRALRTGDPRDPGTEMGPLVDADAVAAAGDGLRQLEEEAEVIARGSLPDSPGSSNGSGAAFFPPLALRVRSGCRPEAVHRVEIFGPVVTLLSYRSVEEAVAGCRAGGGSLVTSVFSEDRDFLRRFTLGAAPWNGRLMTMSGRALEETTGHGIAVPQLVHGGPGRAGGGEELGGRRALRPFLARTAVQGDPAVLDSLFPGEDSAE